MAFLVVVAATTTSTVAHSYPDTTMAGGGNEGEEERASSVGCLLGWREGEGFSVYIAKGNALLPSALFADASNYAAASHPSRYRQMPGLSPTMRFSNFYAGEARRATLWGALVRLRLPSASQIKESINEFLNKTEKFKLAKAEKLNIINLRPSNPAIIDTCHRRPSASVHHHNNLDFIREEAMDLIWDPVTVFRQQLLLAQRLFSGNEFAPAASQHLGNRILIIEYSEKCLAKDDVKGIDEVQELVDLVLEVLPPPSPRSEDEMQGQEEMPTEKAMEED
ncbi:hypothetical protein ZIOFF_010432 [Zingiber officinale]|uniref:Uncharacterized protein n=1 Tax=Zingiber officinale TaxID=94328 RepID=A0A8J5HIT8_ZINOF|nr:hypothetical protein ZIOFF_010432 [Zingiber officinale]